MKLVVTEFKLPSLRDKAGEYPGVLEEVWDVTFRLSGSLSIDEIEKIVKSRTIDVEIQ